MHGFRQPSQCAVSGDSRGTGRGRGGPARRRDRPSPAGMPLVSSPPSAFCAACDRGHAYCSPVCRHAGRARSLRAAGRRHQQSPEGRLDHRDRQRVYRVRCRLRVTHQPSAEGAPSGILGIPRPRLAPRIDRPGCDLGAPPPRSPSTGEASKPALLRVWLPRTRRPGGDIPCWAACQARSNAC